MPKPNTLFSSVVRKMMYVAIRCTLGPRDAITFGGHFRHAPFRERVEN